MARTWKPGPPFDDDFEDLNEVPGWRDPSVLFGVAVWATILLPAATLGVFAWLLYIGTTVPAVAFGAPAGLGLALAGLVKAIGRPPQGRTYEATREDPPHQLGAGAEVLRGSTPATR